MIYLYGYNGIKYIKFNLLSVINGYIVVYYIVKR